MNYSSTTSSLAILEYWRQKGDNFGKAGNLPDELALVRRLNKHERLLMESLYPEGDITMMWYGIFDYQGMIVGITDDYQALKDDLVQQGYHLY